MVAQTKEFPISGVLSTVTGRLMGDIGDVYRVLNWMTGESVFTHQIPRIGAEAVPAILALHPSLAQAVEEADQVNGENYLEWLATWTERYGDVIAVPKFADAEHEVIDPVSEMLETVHPDRIIVIDIGDGK